MRTLIYNFAIVFIFACFLQQQTHAQIHSSDADHSEHSITILAEDYAFQAPNQIPSGWTAIQYENHGNEPHFILLAKIPDGHTFDEYASDVVRPFNEIWHAVRDDGISAEEVMERLGTDLPGWFWAIEFVGGSGIISPGLSSEIALNLEPGTYALECYVKTGDGELHSMEGMLRELTVTETPSESAAPEADIQVTLSNFEMDIQGSLTPGSHTVSVHIKENPEEGFGHNVHVTRLEPDTDVDELVQWMNFFDVEGLMAPDPTTFLGGMHLLPVGQTGYFNVELEPGRYLFISEYTAHLGVMKEVTVE
jgi:hypothetical protein